MIQSFFVREFGPEKDVLERSSSCFTCFCINLQCVGL